MCDHMAHYSCAGMKAKSFTPFKNAVSNVKGLAWFCPDCEPNLVMLLNKIEVLTNKINCSKTVNELPENTAQSTTIERPFTRSQTTQKVLTNLPNSSSPTCTKQINQPLETNCHANPISVTDTIADPIHIASSSVIVSSKIPKDHQQKNDISIIESPLASETHNSNEFETISIVKPRRWVFISRIHSSVTDEQFKKFIFNRFHLQDLNAIRMVPKVKNGGQYNYVSYRISADITAFEVLIKSENWPPGLFIKEFEFTKQNFRISKNIHQIT